MTIFVERTDPAKNESQTEKKKINLQLLNQIGLISRWISDNNPSKIN